jgi:hypothetical protein
MTSNRPTTERQLDLWRPLFLGGYNAEVKYRLRNSPLLRRDLNA